jgi:phosphomethylpyrimidine synthase
MREIALSGGEPPLRVYDSSGPQGVEALDGLPGVREAWITARDVESAVRRYGGMAVRASDNGQQTSRS